MEALTPKVLVGCPIHSVKDYALEQYIKTITTLTYTNYDIYLSDNSADKNHARNIVRKYGIECDWVQSEMPDNAMCGIAQSQNQIRRRCLFGGFDFLFSLEEDVIPPPCIIEILLAHNLEIVSAPYFIGIGGMSVLSMMGIEENAAYPLNYLLPFEESSYKFNGKIIKTDGCGLGCTLIHRSVLERVPDFGIIRSKNFLPSDTFFALDLKRLKIQQYLDTSLTCIHNNTRWEIRA